MELKTLPCLDSSRTFPVNPFRGELLRSRCALLAVLLLIVAMAWGAPAAQAQAVDFGSVNVCPSGETTPAPCSKTLTLTFNIPAGTTIGSISYLTLGNQNLDFKAKANDTSTTLCSAKTYSSATTCTVDVTFAPVAPGQRKGAVQIVDGSGNILANAYIDGTGVGPAIAFIPTIPITDAMLTALGSGFCCPDGIAVDGVGDVFVADDGRVKEILAVNGSIPANPIINTLTGSLVNGAMAVDGSGNIIFAGGPNNGVAEILAVNGSIPANPTVLNLGSGFDEPQAVAVDGSGNVFVADTLNNAVKEILAVNGSIPTNPTIRTLGSLVNIFGIAVDGSGDVFLASDSYDAVVEFLAVNGSIPANPTINMLGSGFFWPINVAVDGVGDVFATVEDTGVGTVYMVVEILAVNGSIPANPTINILDSGLDDGFDYNDGVAVDASGNIFLAKPRQASVFELPSQPPSLSFPSVAVGATGPLSIQIQSIGNATLSLSKLSVSGNFTLVPGSGTPPDCIAGSSVAPGAQCNLSINFKPEPDGPLTGTLTLSDNALNNNPATQVIQLSGYEDNNPPLAQVSTTSMHFATIPFGSGSETLPLTVTNIGGGALTIAPKINGPSYKIASSSCAGNSCVLQVEFNPVAVGGHGDILTLSTNGSSNPTVGLHGVASGVGTEMETPLEFGTIKAGTTETLLLTINNIGVAGTVTIGTKINSPSYKILTGPRNTCLGGITAGHSCTLPVEFDPVAVGNHDDVLTLTPTGGYWPSTVYLHGIAD